jgi:enamine deaminase RidA (YjgF/YER057c/UK114 family)
MSERPPTAATLGQPLRASRFPLPAGWPRGSGYAHAVVAEGRLLFIAGQIGWDPVSERLAPGGLVEQTRQAFRNIAAVLASAGAQPSDLVRLTWFVTDRDAYLRDRKAVGAAYRDVIGRHFPTMSVIVVAGLLEPGALVEIEATAVIPRDTGTTPSTGGSPPTPE